MLTKLRNLRSNNEDGFTLIELLIVVVIIGILASIAIPIFLNQQKAARGAALQSDVHNTVTIVATALTKSPFTTNVKSIAPSDDRVRSTPATSITAATSYDKSTGLYTGNGAWDGYVVIGWTTDLGSTLGDTRTTAYWFDSKTGRYQGSGELA